MVSKPIEPPWNDGSKNLVRTLASCLSAHRPTVLTRRGADLGLSGVRAEAVYRRAGRFAPAVRDNAAVLSRLLFGEHHALWHFFFAPNPLSSYAGRVAVGARRVRSLQTLCSAPRPELDLRPLLFTDVTVVLSKKTERRVLQAGFAKHRVRRIPPAIEPLACPSGALRNVQRAALGLSAERPLLVYPGDLEFSGGAQRMVEAHARLPKSLDAQLVMACRA